jgi:hypothetical protein
VSSNGTYPSGLAGGVEDDEEEGCSVVIGSVVSVLGLVDT